MKLKKFPIWLIIKSPIKFKKSQKPLQQNNSETVTNEHDKEIPKERQLWNIKK